jgi:biopolymer transport protein ExbD
MLIEGLEPEKIFLHADKQVVYEQIIELMTFLQSQGHGKIGLVFQEK